MHSVLTKQGGFASPASNASHSRMRIRLSLYSDVAAMLAGRQRDAKHQSYKPVKPAERARCCWPSKGLAVQGKA